MRRRRTQKKRGAYARNKRAYTYSFRNCDHKTTIYQQTILWRGQICASCNTIAQRFER